MFPSIDDEKENKRYKAIFNALKNKKITKVLLEMSYYNDYFVSKDEFETIMNLFRKKRFTEIQKDRYEKLKDRILRLYVRKYKKE